MNVQFGLINNFTPELTDLDNNTYQGQVAQIASTLKDVVPDTYEIDWQTSPNQRAGGSIVADLKNEGKLLLSIQCLPERIASPFVQMVGLIFGLLTNHQQGGNAIDEMARNYNGVKVYFLDNSRAMSSCSKIN